MIALSVIKVWTPYSRAHIQEYYSEAFPIINVGAEFYPLAHRASTLNVILDVNENTLKKIVRTYFEFGFNAALKEAANPTTSKFSRVLNVIALSIDRTREFLKNVRFSPTPYVQTLHASSIAKYSETNEWQSSPIRYLAWHPHSWKIAVATIEDVIRIYVKGKEHVQSLKHPEQRHITQMSWRPFSDNELAVACEMGIFIWKGFNTGILRCLSPNMILVHPKHQLISSLEWSPDGSVLASCSLNDSSIFIWDVSKQESIKLRKNYPNCTFIKWSPGGTYLFAATTEYVFRVWHMLDNSEERWCTNRGRIQSAAWSPCETCVVFATTEERVLYKMHYSQLSLFADSHFHKEAVHAVDLTEIEIDGVRYGGFPRAICWDAKGQCIAVTFKNTPGVIIFSTLVTRFNCNIVPMSILIGEEHEIPSTISFQSLNTVNEDVILTIAWSSGRVEYVPIDDVLV